MMPLDQLFHLSEALSHYVNIVNVEENELCVVVGILVLVASTLGHVGHGVHLGPCVVNVNSVGLGVSVHDKRDHLLVFAAAFPGHSSQRLRTTGDCCQTKQ